MTSYVSLAYFHLIKNKTFIYLKNKETQQTL